MSSTKLDMSQAHQQIDLEESSQQYDIITTHCGLLQFNRWSFGVSSTRGIFQCIMESLLGGKNGVTVYLDDHRYTGASCLPGPLHVCRGDAANYGQSENSARSSSTQECYKAKLFCGIIITLLSFPHKCFYSAHTSLQAAEAQPEMVLVIGRDDSLHQGQATPVVISGTQTG